MFILITAVYAGLYCQLVAEFGQNRHTDGSRNLTALCVTLLLALAVSVLGGIANNHNHSDNIGERKNWTTAEVILPFVGACNNSYSNPLLYVEDHSLTAYLPYAFLNGFVFSGNTDNLPTTLTDTEESLLSLVYDPASTSDVLPRKDLIIICIESLESWAIGMSYLNGNLILPNITRIVQTGNVLYAPNTKTQVRHGVSSDGHMMINTGLLPLQDGAVCRLYNKNTYPNLAHFYNNSVLVNAVGPDFWGHAQAAHNYGYQRIVKPNIVEGDVQVFTMAMQSSWSDCEMFERATQEWKTMESPKCMMTITISSHTPFNLVEENNNISIPASAPRGMLHYLSCIHYTDSCFGRFFTELEQSNRLDSTTILITGDHTVFKNMMWTEYRNYLTDHKMIDKTARQNYVPIIIIDPDIENRLISDECQQADIYPTLLHLIGAEEYEWHGFGINLADTASRRQFSEYDAYILSDKLIRRDFFKR